MSQLVTADSTADISLNASHFMASLLLLFHGGRREGRAAPENGLCSSKKRRLPCESGSPPTGQARAAPGRCGRAERLFRPGQGTPLNLQISNFAKFYLIIILEN